MTADGTQTDRPVWRCESCGREDDSVDMEAQLLPDICLDCANAPSIFQQRDKLAAELARVSREAEQTLYDLREKVRGKVAAKLSHDEGCDEGWTQGVCTRCDLLASLEVTFGFAFPLAAVPGGQDTAETKEEAT